MVGQTLEWQMVRQADDSEVTGGWADRTDSDRWSGRQMTEKLQMVGNTDGRGVTDGQVDR